MGRRRSGFTLVEVIIALFIGAILTSIAVRRIGDTAGGLAVRQARNVFVGMAARARAQAIESGRTAVLEVSLEGDSAFVRIGTRVVERVHFRRELEVGLEGSTGTLRLCMTPRGYADPACNSFGSVVKLTFMAGAHSESVDILPLGQIRW